MKHETHDSYDHLGILMSTASSNGGIPSVLQVAHVHHAHWHGPILLNLPTYLMAQHIHVIYLLSFLFGDLEYRWGCYLQWQLRHTFHCTDVTSKSMQRATLSIIFCVRYMKNPIGQSRCICHHSDFVHVVLGTYSSLPCIPKCNAYTSTGEGV